MKLIINADDYGLTKGVSLGILKAMAEGVVTETTAMVNGDYFREGIKEAKKRGIKDIGIHLTITGGRPILPPEQVPSLIDAKGNFKRNYSYYNVEEIRKELKAQIESFYKEFSEPSHIDGHHHFYGFSRDLMEIVFTLAEEYKLPLRLMNREALELYRLNKICTTEVFSAGFYGKKLDFDSFKNIILNHKQYETVELMTHPAYVDKQLMTLSSYNMERERELEVLTSEEAKSFIKSEGVELISYKDLVS